jgi:hypothetical protein
MEEAVFIVCRFMALVGVGTIITILAGIALGKVQV